MRSNLDKAQKQNMAFIAAMALMALVYGIRLTSHTMTADNTTLFAISYKYGFISRGLLGTIWLGLDKILPVNLMTYQAVYNFTYIMTMVYYAVLLLFIYRILRRLESRDILGETGCRKTGMYLIGFLCMFAFSGFVTEQMYGRLDLYLYIIMVISALLIIEERAVWLCVLLSIIAVCIHQGYVFTNANVVLVLLLYRYFTKTDRREKRKYGIIFLLTFLSISVLFLYFELFAHPADAGVYNEVITNAKALSPSGDDYNKSIVEHEIMGLDVFESEWQYHLLNYQEFPVFIVLSIPYIILAVSYFKGIIQKRRIEIILYLLGAATILPEVLLKVDYSRYINITFYYYIFMTLSLLAIYDSDVRTSIEDLKTKIYERLPVPEMLLIYIFFFLPVFDVIISGPVHNISTYFIH